MSSIPGKKIVSESKCGTTIYEIADAHTLSQENANQFLTSVSDDMTVVLLPADIKPGTEFTLIQDGQGVLVFDAEEGIELWVKPGHEPQSAGQGAVVKLLVATTGEKVKGYLTGDLAGVVQE